MKDVHRLDVKSAEQNFLSEIEYDFELARGVARRTHHSIRSKDQGSPILNEIKSEVKTSFKKKR